MSLKARQVLRGETEKVKNNSDLAGHPAKECDRLLDRFASLESFPWQPNVPPRETNFQTWLAGFMDHTQLKPEAQDSQFTKLCAEAKEYSFATVCVPPNRVAHCHSLLVGSSVKTITVIGFPLGYADPAAMARETEIAIEAGAGEVDMVIPYGMLKSGHASAIYDSVAAVVEIASKRSIPVKSILESAALSDQELVFASCLAIAAGADFIKTSTGFSSAGGASEKAVEIMRWIAGPTNGVKASGGIRDQAAALKMIYAGASRIGASACVDIVQGGPQSGGDY